MDIGGDRKASCWLCSRFTAIDSSSQIYIILYLRESFLGFQKESRKMLEGKARIKETDMPEKMQIQAMACASQALDLHDVIDCISIAAHVKREFDKMYGSGWQCVVGSNFGCFFTHTPGTFMYFALETLNFLLFKGASS
ncbi:hypothetical protein F2P56_002620 [Juglans regia]|uniref:Dynein light chain n=2 Tax=Juglans regia TaxID=51240 RepID=A0A834D508_JUGRE|nr:dynein light chain LC6, flagellar outer arm-like [Juglans regia]KAF5482019.1 hypothetical protein F2P56_002620 [Juglans regia]